MSINLRKAFPMFVLMFLLKGGLNQIMFLFLFRFFGWLGLNSRSAVCIYIYIQDIQNSRSAVCIYIYIPIF